MIATTHGSTGVRPYTNTQLFAGWDQDGRCIGVAVYRRQPTWTELTEEEADSWVKGGCEALDIQVEAGE